MQHYIVGETGPSDPNRLPLLAKSGKEIPCTRRKPAAPAIMEAAVRMHLDGHDDRMLRSRASEYNCMGLVFASRRGFIDIRHLRLALAGDGYRLVPRVCDVRPGDTVVYQKDGEDAHVGLVWLHEPDIEQATFKTRVLSQWGSDGEYFHGVTDVPAAHGAPVEYWTDRP